MSGLSLAGAQASLQPVALEPGDPTCTPANTTPLTGFTVAANGTVSAPQVPTGRWAVAVTPATAAAAKAARAKGKAAAQVTCTDGTLSKGGQGACSGHGGIKKPDDTKAAAKKAPAPPAKKP